MLTTMARLVPAGALTADVDHVVCDGDCARVLCYCLLPCAFTEALVEPGCAHHTPLCHDCRHACPDCVADTACDRADAAWEAGR